MNRLSNNFIFNMSENSGEFSPNFLIINKDGSEASTGNGSAKELNSVIEIASTKIVDAIQNPPKAPLVSSSLITALISTVCAATAAFIYNKIHWHSVVKRETKTKLLESISDVVNELRTDAISYWLKGYSKKSAKSLLEEEMRIKASLNIINSTITIYVSQISLLKRKGIEGKLRAFHNELYDIITGDDFETQGRKQDKGKVSAISTKCVAFRVLLNTIKF
ncbi:hypothetical protein [Enterobacter hormaechei]|uniref:hypothetical protein n=2 Tax=Enterobacter hormaechei TaxID=158836 RepID=UPI0007A731E5|nr:hypothetical protein [Enterobacter hormaechei]ELC6413592.1 hypothetical protein [Enterobacter hormaechei]MBF4166788.1 hypothetical protein [Enterobacter hormaechei]MDX7065744.1 hypothetical protein [Enterobacter hormaechei]MEC5610274.1 hypothetical protein [Enterobacter hormaechei]QLS10489.1 hypothetical protein HV326_11325 [Enterobacter hormaechei]